MFIQWLPYYTSPKQQQYSRPVQPREWDPQLNKAGHVQISIDLLTPQEVGKPDECLDRGLIY